jgi:hypothetical protein
VTKDDGDGAARAERGNTVNASHKSNMEFQNCVKTEELNDDVTGRPARESS